MKKMFVLFLLLFFLAGCGQLSKIAAVPDAKLIEVEKPVVANTYPKATLGLAAGTFAMYTINTAVGVYRDLMK
jgi:uncharacterized protein YcfL